MGKLRHSRVPTCWHRIDEKLPPLSQCTHSSLQSEDLRLQANLEEVHGQDKAPPGKAGVVVGG